MNFIQAFRMALKSLMGNKVRALLTMLGVIIGVSAVIILVSLGEASSKSITERIQSLGTNMITVNIIGRGSNRTISEDELFAFANKNEDVIEAVAPMISGSVTVKAGNKNVSTTLEGTNEAYRTIRNTDVQQGRFFNALDVERRQKVALIGTYVANELFAGTNAVGQKIKINGELFTVVGLLEQKQNSSQQSSDDKVIIPYTTAKRLLRNANMRTFYVQGKTAETVSQAMEKLEELLFQTFKSTDSYRIFNQAEMLTTISDTTKTLSLMLGGIAAISLVVGGIGIMNIMLVSVTERTREIGIRKSIGAKRINILVQFLIESIVVSGMGGVAGVLIGIAGSRIIGKLMQLSAQPSLSTIGISFSFSVIIGTFFGLYPANKASKLNPIEALRFE
ncbi:MAG: putative transport system permease protein [Petroclostridium sp.]|nr:putative transport system permease protein [Petroclostridium sp.]